MLECTHLVSETIATENKAIWIISVILSTICGLLILVFAPYGEHNLQN